MSDSESEKKTSRLEPELRSMKIEEGSPALDRGDDADSPQVKVEGARPARNLTPITIPRTLKSRSNTQSPVKKGSPTLSASENEELEETVGGDITLRMEPGKAPKLARTASQKVISRPPPLFLDLPDSTEDAKSTFKVLHECTYGNKGLGTTEHALECDCAEEWDSVAKRNVACGEDSDCINRATKMECVGDCSCGAECQNQRFQRKQYADVTVIKTEKKGYGLRTNTDMKPGDFVFEYIGEVINEANFRRRMLQYDEEGIKHFYFMSLNKGEFVDATKKGNLGRFCNHSCNPNCYVDKWVVGDKLRMGIFAERKIKAGEELVFNYNVDRYGADPQPCYCDEPNCTGYIGGKTQTDRATKLSHATIEALGIDDGDGWDTAVAKRPRKKKASEDDEEYINNLQPKSLEEHGVTKVMGALNQCKEKWIAVKLLSRIQRSDDEGVGNRVLRMHGYNILGKTINMWKEDFNVVLQVLDILHKLPRMTRNKIHDSGIETTITDLTTCGDERVESEASRLLEAWSKLTMGYRIPRVKRDPNVSTPVRVESHFERREKARERSKSRSRSPAIDAPKGPSAAPSGPRFNPQKNFLNGVRPPPRPRTFHPLPPGWSEARHPDTGALYYYNSTGHVQWQRPTLPAQQPPPPPLKAKSDAQKLQDIISSITKNAAPTRPSSGTGTPKPVEDLKPEKKSKSDKWKDIPQEKKEKYYENVLAPHIKEVVFSSKYRDRFDKEDLKRLAKEVGKKLVRGDFKANRVEDPRKPLSEKHKATVKKYIKGFMEKAVEKKAARDQVKAEKRAKEKATGCPISNDEPPDTLLADVKDERDDSEDEILAASDDEGGGNISPTDSTAMELKRKREEEIEQGSPKKSRTQAPPPPPPPPPTEDRPAHLDDSGLTLMDDVSDSFQSQAPESVNGANGKSAVPNDIADNFPSPMQLATPPTTNNGSCEHDSTGPDSTNGGGRLSVMANDGS